MSEIRSSSFRIDRRAVLLSVGGALLASPAWASAPQLVVHKTPTCGCCTDWVRHMQTAGFTVRVVEHEDLTPVRTRLRAPDAVASCHIAEVGGYFVEGHVPTADVTRLLPERPRARGIGVPGMPGGSPGMERPDGRVQSYRTLLVDRAGAVSVWAEHGG